MFRVFLDQRSLTLIAGSQGQATGCFVLSVSVFLYMSVCVFNLSLCVFLTFLSVCDFNPSVCDFNLSVCIFNLCLCNLCLSVFLNLSVSVCMYVPSY